MVVVVVHWEVTKKENKHKEKCNTRVNKRIRCKAWRDCFSLGVSRFDKLLRFLVVVCFFQGRAYTCARVGYACSTWQLLKYAERSEARGVWGRRKEEALNWFFVSPPQSWVWKGHFDQCRIIGTVSGSYRLILLFNDEILNIGWVRLQSLAGNFIYSPWINLNLTPSPILYSAADLKAFSDETTSS